MPAFTSWARPSGRRLGGAWMFMAGPKMRRATAMVHTCSSSDGSAASAMRVPGLARKFWMMISWMWPWRSCRSRMASSASMRSARVSPMPIRMPLVNGTRARPAASSVASRTAGTLSGEPKCGPPRRESRSDAVSSMMPCDTDTLRRRVSQASSITPGLRCGNRPVSFSTSAADDSR